MAAPTRPAPSTLMFFMGNLQGMCSSYMPCAGPAPERRRIMVP